MSINFVDTRDFGPVVAIVGGGASGTLLAAQLLRAGGTRVVLIERGARLGRGVAYGTRFAGHLLNVPAASMSGLPDDPDIRQRVGDMSRQVAFARTSGWVLLGAGAAVAAAGGSWLIFAPAESGGGSVAVTGSF